MSNNTTSPVACLSAAETVQVAENVGVYKTAKPIGQTSTSALLAGAFISIAFVFYITVTTAVGSAPYGWVKFLGGACFSLGLMLVVVCGVELFYLNDPYRSR